MAAWMLFDEETMTYQPTVFFNDFWVLQNYLVPVNETVQELPIQLNLNCIGNWKFMMYVQMETTFSMQVRRAGSRVLGTPKWSAGAYPGRSLECFCRRPVSASGLGF